jgi:hypothetical protein
MFTLLNVYLFSVILPNVMLLNVVVPKKVTYLDFLKRTKNLFAAVYVFFFEILSKLILNFFLQIVDDFQKKHLIKVLYFIFNFEKKNITNVLRALS